VPRSTQGAVLLPTRLPIRHGKLRVADKTGHVVAQGSALLAHLSARVRVRRSERLAIEFGGFRLSALRQMIGGK